MVASTHGPVRIAVLPSRWASSRRAGRYGGALHGSVSQDTLLGAAAGSAARRSDVDVVLLATGDAERM